MSSNRLRRIAKEIEDVRSDTWSKVTLEIAGNAEDLTHLEGHFEGPPDTPYEGGKYTVDIRIPNDYPFKPPVMKFATRIWHPNVSSQTVSKAASSLMHPSKLIVSGRDMSRYIVISLVSCPYHQIGTHLAARLACVPRTQGSSGCGSGGNVA